MQYPKILIIGQSFNKNTGGGVTMSNLFTGWPKNNISVASNSNLLNSIDTSVCDTYFQLGYNGKLHPFPLSIILPKIQTGILPISNSSSHTDKVQPVKGGSYKFIYKFLSATMHFFGVYNLFYKLKITKEFRQWLLAWNPDVIYTQLASLELIRFVSQLEKEFNKPIAIHMMDDWPVTINKPGIFYAYWQRIIDKEFRQLLKKTTVFQSISDAMSEEYTRRYGKNSIPFHNPIDINFWKPGKIKNYEVKEQFTILYAGRIGFGIANTISDIATAVNEISKTNSKIVFEIQTGDVEPLNKLVTFNKNVQWVKPINYNQLPDKFSNADILLLPQDFDKKSIDFLRYSFPTKVSEYMISGTPVLVYGDVQTGLTKYAIKNKWAYVVTEPKIEKLVNAINDLFNDINLRKQLGTLAQSIALEKEDANIVKNNFRKSFIV